MTKPKPVSDPQFKRLSEIVETYAPEDLLLILDHYEEGLSTAVRALPLGGKFGVKVMNLDGQTRKRRVPDELVMLTPEGQAWFDRKAQETRQVHLEQRGTIPVNAERILTGEDDFMALFEARRKFIARKLKEEKRGKAAATTGKKSVGKATTSGTDQAARDQGRAPRTTPNPSAKPTATPEA